jgi:hypothetical protein
MASWWFLRGYGDTGIRGYGDTGIRGYGDAGCGERIGAKVPFARLKLTTE